MGKEKENHLYQYYTDFRAHNRLDGPSYHQAMDRESLRRANVLPSVSGAVTLWLVHWDLTDPIRPQSAAARTT